MADIGCGNVLRGACREGRATAGERGCDLRQLESDVGREPQHSANRDGADDQLTPIRGVRPVFVDEAAHRRQHQADERHHEDMQG